MFRKILIIAAFIFFPLTTESKDESFYWVGGSGDWSEFFKHWAGSSGGDPSEFGKVPDAGDTVYFDNNSFLPEDEEIVITIKDNAECLTLDFSKASKKIVFNKNTQPMLKIYGSLILNSDMDFNVNSLNFESMQKGNVIKSEGIKLGNIRFYGIGGGWELLGDLQCGEIYHKHGSFNTKNYNLTCYSYSGASNPDRELYLNNSIIHLTSSNWVSNGAYKTHDAGKSELYLDGLSRTFNTGGYDYHNVYFTNETNSSNIEGGGNFNKVVINSNAYIKNDFTYDSLIFNPGFIYSLISGKTQSVNEYFSSTGECDKYIFIKSLTVNSATTIHSETANIELDYVVLQDLTALGSANFTATNSIDLGNNPGWTITGPTPRALYWVGNGKGYWDDRQSWDESAAGSGGACIPTPFDDVFFDGLDNDTVIVRTPLVFCHDMKWENTGNALFTKELQFPIRIYGSLYLDEALDYRMTNIINFEAMDKGNIIKSASQKLSNIRFYGIDGGWELLGDLQCGEIYHKHGSFNTKNYNLTCYSYSGASNNDRELYLNNSIIHLTNSNWISNGAYKTHDAGKSEIYLDGLSRTFNTGGYDYHNAYFTNETNSSNIEGGGNFNKVVINSNAYIKNDFTYDSLIFNPGFIYYLISGKTQTVHEYLSSTGECDKYIFIKSQTVNSATTIYSETANIELDYVVLQDLTASGSADFTATNSIDLGNNSGWTITGPPPRALYWVGNGKGYWDDRQSWDESSAGSGGACIPTPFDDVFFDGLDNDTVIVRTPLVFCHDMKWENTGNALFTKELQFPIRIYGSLYLDEALDYRMTNIINFEAMDKGNIIKSASQKLSNIWFYGIDGGWELLGDLQCGEIYHKHGSFNTKNYNLTCYSYSGASNPDRELYLNNSIIHLTSSNWVSNGAYKTHDAGKSELYLDGLSRTFNTGGYDYHNVYFTNETNSSNIEGGGNFNKVVINSNAYIKNDFTYDTLEFRPSFNYTLTSGREQKISSFFDCRGNSCFPITIKSSISGSQAAIVKENGIVSCDFLSLTDVRADSGATFYAGAYSKSIGPNNEGWIFENAPDYIYGFGPDTILCEGDILSTFNFNGAKEYLWHDGTTESWHEADETGLYWVLVKYDDDCEFRDSIFIEIISNAFVDAGDDIYVCEKNTEVQVKAKIKDGIAPYEISWEPSIGISNPAKPSVTISSDISRNYILKVKSKNGCYARDTIKYIILDEFKPKIWKDGYYLVSNADKGNQWYMDGEIIPGAVHQKYLPLKTGLYSVVVTSDFGCESEASDPLYFYSSDYDNPTLFIGSTQGSPKDTVLIPLIIANEKDLIESGAENINVNVNFNPSLLYPIDFDMIYVDEKNAYIDINGLNINPDENGVLTYLRFSVGLGNSESCELLLPLAEPNGGEAEMVTVDGMFTLLNICEEGGKRLVNPYVEAGIISISPNPGNSHINLRYTISEKGAVDISIFDMMGRKVKNLVNSVTDNFGNFIRKVDIKDLPTGNYFVVFRSPTIIESRNIVIIK